MSLVCWLPLNGNLNDNGCGMTTITNSGATVNSSGKIGSCYAFDGSDDYIALSGTKLFNCFKGVNQPFSVAMWVLHADSTRAILFGDYATSGGVGFNIELNTSHGVRFYWNSSPDYSPSEMNIGTNVWHHIAFTYDGSSLKGYLDGVLCATRSGALNALNKTTGEFRLGCDNHIGSTALNGRLNDVRIYDSCLSQAEVHEISQGLVLHYKFDHLYKNFSTSNINTWANTTVGVYYSTLFSITMTNFLNETGAKNGDIFTFSVDIKSNANTKRLAARVQHYNSESDRNSVVSDVVIMPGQSGRSYVTFTLDTSYSQLDFMIYNIDSSTQTDNTIELYKCVQIEYGTRPSVWIPIGTTASVLDSSGYGHNGEIIGLPALETIGPRYCSSLHIKAISQKVKITDFPTSGFSNSYTFSWWAKISSVDPMHWGFADGIRLNGMYTGRLWNTDDNSNNPLYEPGTTTQVTAPTVNTWHHWVMTGDGTTCKVYQDGVHWATAKTYKSISGSTIYINGWDSGTSHCSNDLTITDFRIYCTALKAEDVKQLYEVGAKVDNIQKLHTYEVREAGKNLLDSVPITNAYNAHTDNSNFFINYNINGEYHFTTNSSSAGTPYIPIDPRGKTYYYDCTISVNAGNQFYIGFERYDATRTERSDNGCVYIIDIKPSSHMVKQHYSGTVDLSTDGTNPCRYIALRILNGWSGTTSGVTGTATIHNISLREVSSLQQPKLFKYGQFLGEELKEKDNTKLYPNGIIETDTLIEI